MCPHLRLAFAFAIILSLSTGCAKPTGPAVSAAVVTAPTFSNGKIVDGDGEVQTFVENGTDAVKRGMQLVASARQGDLVDVSTCAGYTTADCAKLAALTAEQRAAVVRFAMTASAKALADYAKLRIVNMEGPLYATGRDGGRILVDAKNDESTDWQVDFLYSYTKSVVSNPIAFRQKLAHEIMHESTHLHDYDDVDGFTGDRQGGLVIDLSSMVVSAALGRTETLPTCTITQNGATPTVRTDVDGTPLEDLPEVTFKVELSAGATVASIKTSVGTLTFDPASRLGNVTLDRAGAATLTIAVKQDATSLVGSCTLPFKYDLRFPEIDSIDKVHHDASAPTRVYGLSRATPSAPWVLEGRKLGFIRSPTPRCATPLYQGYVPGQVNFAYGSTPLSVALGYVCDAKGAGMTALYLITIPGGQWIVTDTELSGFVASGATLVKRLGFIY